VQRKTLVVKGSRNHGLKRLRDSPSVQNLVPKGRLKVAQHVVLGGMGTTSSPEGTAESGPGRSPGFWILGHAPVEVCGSVPSGVLWFAKRFRNLKEM
jgi:hypothetical protein